MVIKNRKTFLILKKWSKAGACTQDNTPSFEEKGVYGYVLAG